MLRSRNQVSENTKLRVTSVFFSSIIILQLRRPMEFKFSQVCYFMRMLRYTKWEDWSLTIIKGVHCFLIKTWHDYSKKRKIKPNRMNQYLWVNSLLSFIMVYLPLILSNRRNKFRGFCRAPSILTLPSVDWNTSL